MRFCEILSLGKLLYKKQDFVNAAVTTWAMHIKNHCFTTVLQSISHDGISGDPDFSIVCLGLTALVEVCTP